MTDYTPTGYPDPSNRWVSALLDNEFALIAAAVNSKINGNLFVMNGTEAQGATVNDYVVTVSPAITAYTSSSVVLFKSTHANTGAVTLKISALTAKTLKAVDGSALESGDIENGSVVAAFYDGTDFLLVSGNDRSARAGDTYAGTHNFTAATLTATTQPAGDNSAKVATTAYADNVITNGTNATSTTNLTIGTGTNNLTIQTDKSLVAGMQIICAYTTTPTIQMRGPILSYDSGTGALSFSSTNFDGTKGASYATWTISIGGADGVDGVNGVQTITTTATLVAGIHYYANSSAGSFTATTPAAPTNGDIITVSDPLGAWATYPVTLDGNGSNFVDQYGVGQAENFELNVAGVTVTFIYTALGWRVI